MKILFLTFYYRPDLCAGSFRATPLVDTLARHVPSGGSIDVVTTQPNRYRSFSAECAQIERCGVVSIRRVPLPKHASGMIDQSRAFATFAHAAVKHAADRKYDLVVGTSSRLMTAVLAAFIARRQRARLYLDIRDIFGDTMSDILPAAAAFGLAPILSALERYAVSRADAVNLISPGFADYFRSRYPAKKYSFFTNGIDDEFLRSGSSWQPSPPPAVLTVLYAGNIGEGQGLHAIVPAIATRLGSRVRFRIIGDGGRREALRDELARLGVRNVELLPPVSRETLHHEYREADVLFLHLNDHEAFQKVLPSKIFEYAALGKPIWAGVGGYASQFIRDELDNAAVFAPCDADAAVRAFGTLTLGASPRRAFIERYRRATIDEALAADILATAR